MHKTAEFLALSRWGQVPVLQHGGRVLLQSGAILEYLADTFGTFAGGDPGERQEIREWLFWNADRLSPPLFGWYGVELGRRGLLPLSFEPAVVRRWQDTGETALSALDNTLAARAFLVGAHLTIADLCCYGEIAFARLSGAKLARWPHLTRWAAGIEALTGFATPLDLLPMSDAEIATA